MDKLLTPLFSVNEFLNLGLEFLGKGSYDPSSPDRIYFTIGNVISALALFFVFTQLLRPIVKFRISIGYFKPKLVYILFVIAIIFVFLASLLPFIPGTAIPLISYPFFWEFLAGLIIFIGVIGFFWSINHRAKLNSHNYKSFYNGCFSLIAKGNDNDLRKLAEEISYSIKEVINKSKVYNKNDLHRAENEGKKYIISEYTKYALGLLDIWSDPKFCEIIVCYFPGTAQELFQQIEEQDFYYSGGHSFVNQIIHQAYYNNNSILHREEDFTGLGHIKKFTHTVFGNYKLIISDFRPLEAFSSWKYEDIQIRQIEKYCETLNISLKSLLKNSGWNCGNHSVFKCAFSEIQGIVYSECIKLDKTPKMDVYQSQSFKKFSIIQRELQNIIKLVIQYDDKLPEYDLSEENYDHYLDDSIYGIIAYAIYEYFEGLAIVKNQDEAVRDLAIRLWLDIYPVSKRLELKPIREIQKRLTIHLIRKIKENLINQYYPAITRLLINIISLYQGRKADEEFGIINITNKLFELLRMHFERAYDNSQEKALDMIPSNTKYDVENSRLIQTIRIDQEPYILNLKKNN